jgi:Na+-translocating ferredoxin:NAD+ oxidoreductase RnfD subunit
MIFVAIIAAASALGTWLLGWWAVAIVAVLAGAVVGAEHGRAWRVALGCLGGWAVLLLLDAAVGPMRSVATTVSGAMSIPSGALLLVTLLFPALIGWSGATLGALGGGSRASRATRPLLHRAP